MIDGDAMFAPLMIDEPAEATPRTPTKKPIVPVPPDAPPMSFNHPKRGAPSRSWPYHDAEGRLVGYVCRWDFLEDDGKPAKEILPVTFCDIGNGRRGWRSKGIPSPRPLFDLPAILRRADVPVLICEGEKTRDAAATLFPGMVATTPAHGANSPKLTSFDACAGRTVIIATDHDAPDRPHHSGRDFGDAVCELARSAGAVEILHLSPHRLATWARDGGERSGPLPDGWDLADALDEGWTAEKMGPLLADAAFLTPYPDPGTRSAANNADASQDATRIEARPWPFRLVAGGVEKRVERVDRETKATSVEWKWFCSTLEIAAETRSTEGEEWGRLLRITDRDGRMKSWAMPMAMLAGDGTAYRERLLSLGLIMAPGAFAREALHEYISTARPDKKARCVNRVGWHAASFTLSNETVRRSHG